MFLFLTQIHTLFFCQLLNRIEQILKILIDPKTFHQVRTCSERFLWIRMCPNTLEQLVTDSTIACECTSCFVFLVFFLMLALLVCVCVCVFVCVDFTVLDLSLTCKSETKTRTNTIMCPCMCVFCLICRRIQTKTNSQTQSHTI